MAIGNFLGMDSDEFDEAMRNFLRLGLTRSGSEFAVNAIERGDKVPYQKSEDVSIYSAVNSYQDITTLAVFTPFGVEFSLAVGLEPLEIDLPLAATNATRGIRQDAGQ